MKKAIWITSVLLVISLICTVCFGVALGSQGIRAFFRDDGVLDSWVERIDDWSETAAYVNDWDDIDDLFDEDSRAYRFDSKEVELPAGETLSLYADCGDIRILRSTGDTVKATLEQYSKRSNPTSKYDLAVENDSVLRLTAQPDLKGTWARLTVYLPQQLTELRVEVDAGDVYLENLAADMLSVQMDAGDLDLDNITAGTLSVKVLAGNLDLSRVTAKNITVDVDAGDIDIERGVTASEFFTLNCACGDVDFELPESVPFTLEYTVQMGDADIDSSVHRDYIHSANHSGTHCTGSLVRASTDGTAESVIQIHVDLGDLDITFKND